MILYACCAPTYDMMAGGPIVNERRCFYLRGYSTFFKDVFKNQTAVSRNKALWGIYRDKMKQIILKRPSLKRLDIGIGTQTYSVRQAQNGLSNKRQPLLLRKAFETLILLQALTIDVFKRTGDSRDPLDTVYELMHIEPAISHFPDLTRAHVEQVERRGKENKDWASALREYTGQRTLAWLHDVAKKEKTITHKLALKTKGFLTKIFPT